MHDRGCQQTQSAVMMVVIVPVQERMRPLPRIGGAAKAFGIIGPIFHRLELRFGIRVVIRDVRTRVRRGDAEITEELRERLSNHRCAIIGMYGELLADDALLLAGGRNQFFG